MTRRQEDKRESPDEFDTEAAPKNEKDDRSDRKDKGKSTHALETKSPTQDRPSRVSTRRGANGVKPDAQQRRQAVREVHSPQARHGSRSG